MYFYYIIQTKRLIITILFMTHKKQQQNYIQHVLNNSLTKSIYTFPKQKRFQMYFQNTNSNISKFYDLPDVSGKRSAGIGYGLKSSIITKKDLPGPNIYDIKSQFQKSKYKGFNFGTSREKLNTSISNENLRKPGPGYYDLKIIDHKILIGMGSKITMKQQRNNNSPAFIYNTQSISLANIGKYPISKFKQNRDIIRRNPGSFRIRTESSRANPEKNLPGPGQYTPRTALSPGQYQLSTMNSSRIISFTKSKRKEIVEKSAKNIPGPGNYTSFSQFGTFTPIIKNRKNNR